MSSKSIASSTALPANFPQNISSTTTPPTSTASNSEPVPSGGGFALQDNPGDKSFAAQLRLPSPAKDYFYASFGAITEGHYTEF
jgi:hypothetical protein